MSNINQITYIRPLAGRQHAVEVRFDSAMIKGSVKLKLSTAQLIDPIIEMLAAMSGDERLDLINAIVDETTALAKMNK